jgi:hypothetical protein
VHSSININCVYINKTFFSNCKVHSTSKIAVSNYLMSLQLEIIQHRMRQKDDHEERMKRTWKEAVMTYVNVVINSTPVISWWECQCPSTMSLQFKITGNGNMSRCMPTCSTNIVQTHSLWFCIRLNVHLFLDINSVAKLVTLWILHRSHELFMTNQLHGAEAFLRSRQFCSYLRISQHFMEPEVSLLRLQGPSIGPYPEPDQFSPYHPILSL